MSHTTFVCGGTQTGLERQHVYVLLEIVEIDIPRGLSATAKIAECVNIQCKTIVFCEETQTELDNSRGPLARISPGANIEHREYCILPLPTSISIDRAI